MPQANDGAAEPLRPEPSPARRAKPGFGRQLRRPERIRRLCRIGTPPDVLAGRPMRG